MPIRFLYLPHKERSQIRQRQFRRPKAIERDASGVRDSYAVRSIDIECHNRKPCRVILKGRPRTEDFSELIVAYEARLVMASIEDR